MEPPVMKKAEEFVLMGIVFQLDVMVFLAVIQRRTNAECVVEMGQLVTPFLGLSKIRISRWVTMTCQ